MGWTWEADTGKDEIRDLADRLEGNQARLDYFWNVYFVRQDSGRVVEMIHKEVEEANEIYREAYGKIEATRPSITRYGSVSMEESQRPRAKTDRERLEEYMYDYPELLNRLEELGLDPEIPECLEYDQDRETYVPKRKSCELQIL